MADETGHDCSFEWHFKVHQGKTFVNSKQYVTKMYTNGTDFPYLSDIVMPNLLPSIKALGNLV